MAVEHFLLFGLVEAAVTALVLVYLRRTAPAMLGAAVGPEPLSARVVPVLALGLGLLILLAPLGLLLPKALHAGSAWGEWSAGEVNEEIAKAGGSATAGYVPAGIRQAEEHGWRAAMPDYAFRGQESAGLAALSLAYVISGVLGVATLVVVIWLFARRLAREEAAGGTTRLGA